MARPRIEWGPSSSAWAVNTQMSDEIAVITKYEQISRLKT